MILVVEIVLVFEIITGMSGSVAKAIDKAPDIMVLTSWAVTKNDPAVYEWVGAYLLQVPR